MTEPSLSPPSASRFHAISQSLTFRTVVVALLGLLMLIPLGMTETVVSERNGYHSGMLEEIAATWGARQTVVGPVLVIPYVEHLTSVDTVTDKDGTTRVVSKDIFNDHTAILLPKTLEIHADLKEEHRQRGIYDALVYSAKLNISGQFDHSPLLKPGDEGGERRIQWDKAFVMVGVSDTKALAETSDFSWGNAQIKLEPGTRQPDLLANGFHAPLSAPADTKTTHDFKLSLTLHGSDSLNFAPLGETTKARITSTWAHPSFQGNSLPTKRTVNAQGFNAEWDIPYLVRNYPQYWVMDDKQKHDLNGFTAGVSLYEPVSLYSQVIRAVKYGVLFIGLTFLTFFGFEISVGKRLHVLQYSLVGVALSLFYLLLLALAEHIAFVYAYVSAAGVVVLVITLYTWAVLRSFRSAMLVLLLLSGLYGVLYLLLEMEDYALLVGTGLLAVATSSMMYVTRNLRQTD